MRTAALPNFRKPYRILIKNQNIIFKTGLPAGNYILEIENSKFIFNLKNSGLV